jgi:hypothetical protein
MNSIVRAVVVALAVTGAIASVHHTEVSSETSIGSKMSALPVPTCPPDDANGCGIRQLGH